MGYASIKDPSVYFQAVLYTGTGSTQSVGNDGNSNLKPDWVWIKKRNSSGNHSVFDSTRGATKELVTNGTNAEATDAQLLTQFDTDGFTVGTNSGVNGSSDTFVAWQWKANGGTTSSNTDGSITSTVQADTTAGFSIVSFTGNGSNDATIGHGLGTTPAMIITKNLSESVSWRVWHQNLTAGTSLFLNSNNGETAAGSHGAGYIKTVGSSTYTTYQGTSHSDGVNGNGDSMIAYCFAEKQGYSKFGQYYGNGNGTAGGGYGPFIYTGFKPAFVMIKRTNTSGNFFIMDSKRDPINVMDKRLFPNLTNAEQTNTEYVVDFLSNGFKLKGYVSQSNASGSRYTYMAFAEHPFVTSKGTPTTAR